MEGGMTSGQIGGFAGPEVPNSGSFENVAPPGQRASEAAITLLCSSGLRFKPVSQIYYTLFANEFAQELQHYSLGSLAELAELIRSPIAASKGELPLLKLAWYGDRRTEKGCLRHNANVEWISGCELDIDDANGVTLAGAAQRLQKAGVRAMVYSSPSWTAEKPKYRILAPTSGIYYGAADKLRELRAQLVARVNGVIGGIAAHQESFTLSHSFYFGSVARRPPVQIVVTRGKPIDLLNHLDATAIGKPARRAGEKREAPEGLIECDLEGAPSELIEAAKKCVLSHRGDGNRKYALANRLLDLRHRGRILSEDAVVDLLCWYDPTCPEDHARGKVAHAIEYRKISRGARPATIAEEFGL